MTRRSTQPTKDQKLAEQEEEREQSPTTSEEERDTTDLVEDDDEKFDADEPEPISKSNILKGNQRTRHKKIDFKKLYRSEKGEGNEYDEGREYKPPK